MKVVIVHTTIGSREHYEDGRTRYISAPTDEGWCYKDNDAWDRRGICYIPEVDFRSHEFILEESPDLGYTREDIENIVRETLEDLELPFSEDFVQKKARCVFDIATWESIGVVVERIDWEEELNLFNMKEN